MLSDELKIKISPFTESYNQRLQEDIGKVEAKLAATQVMPANSSYYSEIRKIFLSSTESYFNEVKKIIFNEIKNKKIDKPTYKQVKSLMEDALNDHTIFFQSFLTSRERMKYDLTKFDANINNLHDRLYVYLEQEFDSF